MKVKEIMTKNKDKILKFSNVLSQLRKERGISQKKAATELGISQALLSHYEKGIRECGLDFIIRCSEYYGVTTDYLLGVSENRNGISNDYLSAIESDESYSVSMLAKATKYLLDTVALSSSDPSEKKFVCDYYLLTLYRGALTLAKAGVLPKELFKIDYSVAKDLASAAIAMQDAKFVLIEDRSRTGVDSTRRTVLNDLIEEAETMIMSNLQSYIQD